MNFIPDYAITNQGRHVKRFAFDQAHHCCLFIMPGHSLHQGKALN
jgi:hypothetical protein